MANILRYAGFIKESKYGVRAAGDPFHVDVASATLDAPSDTNLIYGGGLGKSARTYRPGYYAPAGNVVYAFDVETIVFILKCALGGYQFTAGSDLDLNEHIIWANENITLPSFACDLGKDVFEHRFMGCVVSSLEIAASNEFCQATVGIQAQKDAKATLLTAANLSLPDAYPLAFHEMTAKIATVDASAKIKDLTLSIDNGVSADKGRTLGSRYPRRMPGYERTVTYTLNMLFDDLTELERFWGGASGPALTGSTETSLEILLDGGDYGSLSMFMPKTVYTGVQQQPSGRDEIVQVVNGRAFIGEAPLGAPVDCTETELYCVLENNEETLA